MPLLDNYIPVAGSDYAGGIVENGLDVIHNPGIRRPYLDDRNRPCVTVNTGRWTVEKGVRVPLREKRLIIDLMNQGFMDPVFLTANASALRKEAWIELDRTVIMAARPRLKAWGDLEAANSFGGFNGMAKMTLEYEAMSDPGEAIVDMDAMTEGRTDSPLFSLRSIPLPITHSDFWFSERRLSISRGSGTPLDTTMAEAAGRRVAEMIEKTTIGLETGVAYGEVTSGPTAHEATIGSQVYGYTNYPYRLTKTNFTAPTAGGWTPETTHNELLAAINQLQLQNFYGPFRIYTSRDWFPYINRQFSIAGGNNAGETLLTMLMKIPSISGISQLDYLTSTFTFIIVQMTSDVARAVNGMDITTVQWPSVGGMRQNFKVMAIKVPQLRSDYLNQAGILHGTTA